MTATPETRDAIEGLEYAVAAAEESELGYVTVDTAQLRALLSVVGPGEQPTVQTTVRCAHCGKPLDDNATANYLGAKVCHTRTQPPYAHPTDCYQLLTEGEELGARDLRNYRDRLADQLIDEHNATKADRHAPLTDEPCGVIPTKAGRRLVDDYRAHRTQQHPDGAADA